MTDVKKYVLDLKERMNTSRNEVIAVITSIIKKELSEVISIDNNNNYYAEVMALDKAPDAEYDNICDLWFSWCDHIRPYVNKCVNQLSILLKELDTYSEVVGDIFTDNSILFLIIINGTELILEFRNTYNK